MALDIYSPKSGCFSAGRQYELSLFARNAWEVKVNSRYLALCALAFGLIFSPAHGAEDIFPSRAIRIISPYAAGGSNSIIGRVIADRLQGLLSQAVVVENRAGANGIIGADYVAKSKPDGYTLLVSNSSSNALNSHIYKNIPYNTEKDFTPISLITVVPLVIIVHSSNPANTLKEFVANGKRDKAREGVTFGSPGVGGTPHLAGALFQLQTGLHMVHVPYTGDAPAITAVVANQIDCAFAVLASALPQIRGGRVKALAVTGAARSPALPDVPSTTEAGFAGLELGSWFGISGPAGMPSAVVNRLSAAITQIVKDSEVIDKIRMHGGDAMATTPDEFKAFIGRSSATFGKAVRAANLKTD